MNIKIEKSKTKQILKSGTAKVPTKYRIQR